TKGHIHYPQAIEPLLASTVVPDNTPTWFKFRVWLEAGQTPRFIFPNGPYESRASVVTINKRYKDEFKGDVGSSGVGRAHILLEGQLPHIRIREIKINGPVPEKNGGAEEVAVFGKDGFQAEHALDQLQAFAEKAYRRPLTDADREPIRALYDKRLAEKASPRQAALDALKLILCSPSFLYLSEITEESAKALSPYDLATRLSFALWATPPDEALLASAKSGKLTQDAELKKQIQRMLADERISGFVNGFLDSWLNLRELGGMPPPREVVRAYYAEDLPTSMKTEATLFFRDLLKNNGSVMQFLDSDHSFVDKKLAKLYELPEQKTLRLADGFQKVSLKGDAHRGGLLGMAAVLTVSANGVETSPVTRGVWVSENILGIPPPPPPDVVPAIDPDVSGATTIRDRLAKHRADAACAECHRKIDPLGFSLESFDPVGRWRSKYPQTNKKTPAAKIDTTGEFPSGETYADFASFKKLIYDTRADLFSRHLIRQILTYTTGRTMELNDDFIIDKLQAKVKQQGLGLNTLMVECLMSEVFRSR
ncbi:MAG: signal peptide protein, partial [Prosthecobacter sp.]|nr:signal peptide protein [Prosthecobacter sp.]